MTQIRATWYAVINQLTTTQSEIEETLKRITSHQGVEGLVIVNAEGIPIRSNLDNDLKIKYASLITQLTAQARSVVRDLNPQNDLTFLRVRTKFHEILVAPGNFSYVILTIRQGIFTNSCTKYEFRSTGLVNLDLLFFSLVLYLILMVGGQLCHYLT